MNGELLIEHHGPDHIMLHGKIWNLSEGEHREELMKYSAIQSFIAAFEGHESEAYARANLELFALQVDAQLGGPTAKTLGGRKIANKLNVQELVLMFHWMIHSLQQIPLKQSALTALVTSFSY